MAVALWHRLQLDMVRTHVVALVGGGGKSSTLYALAREARDAGRTVIITTTTHIMAHPGLFRTDEADAPSLSHHLSAHGILTLGRYLKGDKLTGAGDVAVCRQVADLTLVEADGARERPLKAPADHEPVIPACADAVLALAGMDAVGQPIGAVCHRPEQVCALLQASPSHPITPADVATLLASPRGGRKSVDTEMAFRCVLNKADTPPRKQYAAEIICLLQQSGIIAVATAYAEKERGGKCLF